MRRIMLTLSGIFLSLVLGNMASAGQPMGTYTFVCRDSCVASSATFSNLTTSGATSLSFDTGNGTITFDGKGTETGFKGTGTGTGTVVGTGLAGANGMTVNITFNYNVNWDGIVTLSPPTFSGTVESGPGAGLTYTLTGGSEYTGKLDPFGMVFIGSTISPAEMTTTFYFNDNGTPVPVLTQYQICDRSLMFVR